MKVHPYGMAAQGIGPGHPINHDIIVDRLTDPLAATAAAAIKRGDLSCYIAPDGTRWIPRVQLGAAIGFRVKLHDPTSRWFVPPEAIMTVPYMPVLVTNEIAAASPYQARVLTTARDTAEYLKALHAAMPPLPFDLHVNRTAAADAPLRCLVLANAVASYPSDCGWWIHSAEAQVFLPDGESFDAPASAWYADPHDWADQEEVEKLIADHRRRWPEIYSRALEEFVA